MHQSSAATGLTFRGLYSNEVRAKLDEAINSFTVVISHIDDTYTTPPFTISQKGLEALKKGIDLAKDAKNLTTGIANSDQLYRVSFMSFLRLAQKDDDSDSESDNNPIIRQATKVGKRKPRAESSGATDDEEDESDEDDERPSRSKRKKKKKNATANEDDLDQEDDERPSLSKKKKQATANEDELDKEDDERPPRSKKKKQVNWATAYGDDSDEDEKPPRSKKKKQVNWATAYEDDSEEDEKPPRSKKKMIKAERSSDEEDDDERSSSSSLNEVDEVFPSSSPNARAQRAQRRESMLSSSSMSGATSTRASSERPKHSFASSTRALPASTLGHMNEDELPSSFSEDLQMSRNGKKKKKEKNNEDEDVDDDASSSGGEYSPSKAKKRKRPRQEEQMTNERILSSSSMSAATSTRASSERPGHSSSSNGAPRASPERPKHSFASSTTRALPSSTSGSSTTVVERMENTQYAGHMNEDELPISFSEELQMSRNLKKKKEKNNDEEQMTGTSPLAAVDDIFPHPQQGYAGAPSVSYLPENYKFKKLATKTRVEDNASSSSPDFKTAVNNSSSTSSRTLEAHLQTHSSRDGNHSNPTTTLSSQRTPQPVVAQTAGPPVPPAQVPEQSGAPAQSATRPFERNESDFIEENMFSANNLATLFFSRFPHLVNVYTESQISIKAKNLKAKMKRNQQKDKGV